MKRLFKKIARFFVTVYANRIYNQGVKKAEEVRRKSHKKAYLIINPIKQNKMIALTSSEFKAMKKRLNVGGIYNTVIHVQNTCFYYTQDQFGKNGMSDKDKKIRRLAFVRYMIMRARL